MSGACCSQNSRAIELAGPWAAAVVVAVAPGFFGAAGAEFAVAESDDEVDEQPVTRHAAATARSFRESMAGGTINADVTRRGHPPRGGVRDKPYRTKRAKV